MATEKKATEYRVANYDGRLKAVPEAGLSGKLEIKPDGTWELDFGFRKKVSGQFLVLPLVVTPLSEQSSQVTIRQPQDPNYGVRFELPETPAAVILQDLAERGFTVQQLAAAIQARAQGLASGQWWLAIKPCRILISCHYSGARNKNEAGSLHATAKGLQYKALLGSKVSIPWLVIRDIEISTQATKRVTAGRVLAVGVFALAAKKNEVFTYVHISDANTVWSFAVKSPQPRVLAAMQPVLNAFNKRVQPSSSAPAVARPAYPTPAPATVALSVADELAKLAKLKTDGVLTDEEFAVQKAKLLGTA